MRQFLNIGLFVLDDDNKVVSAQFAAHAFRDECIVDFSAVRFYGMEFLFVGRPQFPVFNGIMVHPALFGYVPQIGYGFIDGNVFKACKDALKNGSQ